MSDVSAFSPQGAGISELFGGHPALVGPGPGTTADPGGSLNRHVTFQVAQVRTHLAIPTEHLLGLQG